MLFWKKCNGSWLEKFNGLYNFPGSWLIFGYLKMRSDHLLRFTYDRSLRGIDNQSYTNIWRFLCLLMFFMLILYLQTISIFLVAYRNIYCNCPCQRDITESLLYKKWNLQIHTLTTFLYWQARNKNMFTILWKQQSKCFWVFK